MRRRLYRAEVKDCARITGSRQAGAFVVLFPFVMIALFGLVGLTLTSGNTFADRAKLQNLLDAMALSTATTVNILNAKGLADSELKCTAPHLAASGIGAVQTAANALSYGTALPANRALLDVLDDAIGGGSGSAKAQIVIEYATRLASAAFSQECPQTSRAQPIFVRLRLTHPIQTPEFMIQVLRPWLGGETYDVQIAGSSVAGPVPAMPYWTSKRCPLPAFVCDRSDIGDADHPPSAPCRDEPNDGTCSYGYPANQSCSLPEEDATGPWSLCSEIQAQVGQHSLRMEAGFGPEQGLEGHVGACPAPPDDSGQLTLASVSLSPNELRQALGSRLPIVPPGLVVPVLDCSSSSTVRTVKGYVCLDVVAGEAAAQLRLKAVASGLMPGGCGASPRIQGPGSLPAAPGLRPPLWRIVLFKDFSAADS